MEASDPGGEGTEMASSWVVSMDLHSKHVISCLYIFFTGFKYTCTSNSEGYIAESHMELIFEI